MYYLYVSVNNQHWCLVCSSSFLNFGEKYCFQDSVKADQLVAVLAESLDDTPWLGQVKEVKGSSLKIVCGWRVPMKQKGDLLHSKEGEEFGKH
jgi:hypothetical protein